MKTFFLFSFFFILSDQFSFCQNRAVNLYTDAAVAFANGDYPKCIDLTNQLLNLEPDYSSAYFLRGESKYFGFRDFNGAMQDFNMAIKLNKEYGFAYFSRGNAKFSLEDYRGAIADYDLGLKFEPDYSPTIYYRGLSKILLRDKDGGCNDLSKAGELGYNKAYEMIKKFCN